METVSFKPSTEETQKINEINETDVQTQDGQNYSDIFLLLMFLFLFLLGLTTRC